MILATVFACAHGQTSQEVDLTSTDGRSLKGVILRSNNDSVMVRRSDGAEFEIPLSKLNPESRARIGAMSGLVQPSPASNLDSSFGQGGKVVTPFGEGTLDSPQALAIQADGKIVVAGYSGDKTNLDIAVARYLLDGSLDTSFGGTGKVTTHTGGQVDHGYGVACQSDGKIVVVGKSHNGRNSDFVVVRYNADGTLDTTFNGSGFVLTDVSGGTDFGQGVAIQKDGRILVVGETSTKQKQRDVAIVRYNADGSLDLTFNGTGKLMTNASGGEDVGRWVTELSDGRIVAVGMAATPAGRSVVAIRCNADGTLDTTFNVTGKLISSAKGSTYGEYSALAQPDGAIIAASSGPPESIPRSLIRFLPNGSRDPGLESQAAPASPGPASTLMLQDDGKILLVKSLGQGAVVLARFNADGRPDGSFGSAGQMVASIGIAVRGVAVQKDGKIVIAGGSPNGNDGDFGLVRLNP